MCLSPILINGINIKEVDLVSWYAQIGTLFQDFIKYHLTLKEDVFYGNKDENRNIELLKKAVAQSGVDAHTENLSQK